MTYVCSSVNQNCQYGRWWSVVRCRNGSVNVIASSRIVIATRKRIRRTTWARPLFQRHCEYGTYNMLMAELRESDTDRYQGSLDWLSRTSTSCCQSLSRYKRVSSVSFADTSRREAGSDATISILHTAPRADVLWPDLWLFVIGWNGLKLF